MGSSDGTQLGSSLGAIDCDGTTDGILLGIYVGSTEGSEEGLVDGELLGPWEGFAETDGKLVGGFDVFLGAALLLLIFSARDRRLRWVTRTSFCGIPATSVFTS